MLSVGGSLAQLHNGHAHARERAPREPSPDFSLAPSFPNAAHKNALVVVAQQYERNINSYVRYSYNTISRLREAESREWVCTWERRIVDIKFDWLFLISRIDGKNIQYRLKTRSNGELAGFVIRRRTVSYFFARTDNVIKNNCGK